MAYKCLSLCDFFIVQHFFKLCHAYQKEYRLQLAQKLLLETDCTVAEIAHRVGYENPNKFSSAFREAAGMTPTEYRKMRPIG